MRSGDLADTGDRPVDALALHHADVDRRHAEIALVREVLRLAVHRPADADLHVARRIDQPLLDRAAERRAMEVLAAEVVAPGVDVRVELHERDRPVRAAAARRHGSEIE
jgi:hypothetical protein